MKVIKDFSWAYDGVRIKAFKAGDDIADDDQCVAVALSQGWIKSTRPAPKDKNPVGGEHKQRAAVASALDSAADAGE